MREDFPADCQPFVIGHPAILRRAVELLRLDLKVIEITDPAAARPRSEGISCLACGSDDAARVAPATVDPRGGQAAFDATVLAARLALAGRIDAMVTAPLNKAALHAAGHPFPGHTELLASLCGIDRVAMMLYLSQSPIVRGRIGLGVAHVTLHMAMREVFEHLNAERIIAGVQLAHDVSQRFLRARQLDDQPVIGVCALNPHAGEQGLFGREEIEIIAPAVDRARAGGMDVHGPLPVDTLFGRAKSGEFDAVVAMYHDQGHIALKLLDMHRAVNITLGLPIIRTSVAHGTAFDLAWQGRAETGGMIEALRVASMLAGQRTADPHSSNTDSAGAARQQPPAW
jgi:4-hydroxythreonine-4-phosphate dehydrogenase